MFADPPGAGALPLSPPGHHRGISRPPRRRPGNWPAVQSGPELRLARLPRGLLWHPRRPGSRTHSPEVQVERSMTGASRPTPANLAARGSASCPRFPNVAMTDRCSACLDLFLAYIEVGNDWVELRIRSRVGAARAVPVATRPVPKIRCPPLTPPSPEPCVQLLRKLLARPVGAV